jgi:hypothetical protein
MAIVPAGTQNTPFAWIADRDIASMALRINGDAKPSNPSADVQYRLKVIALGSAASPAPVAVPLPAPSPAPQPLTLSDLANQTFAEVEVQGVTWAPLRDGEDLYRPRNSKNLQQLQSVPRELSRRSFTRFPMFNRIDGATLRFTIKTDGIVLIAFNGGWGGGGSGGAWQRECISKEALAQQGWQSIGKMVDDDAFYRMCKAGETFQLRNNKYAPPILIK